LTKCRMKTKSRFEEKLSPGVLDLVNFSQINIIFRFRKDALRLGSNIFETFRFAPKKNKSVKEFVRFSTTDVFVPVSQLSTRDLFDFLENLKFKQDMFCLEFLVVFDESNDEHYDIPIPDYFSE